MKTHYGKLTVLAYIAMLFYRENYQTANGQNLKCRPGLEIIHIIYVEE